MKALIPRLLAASSFLLLLTGSSTRPAMPAIGEVIQVNLVNLDVVVTRKDGTRVHGLTREDFQILENGQPREISNFAEYCDTRPGEKPQKRSVVFFIERVRMPKFESERFAETLRATARNLIRRGDAAAVVLWDGKSHVRIDFTDDVASVENVLTAVAAGVPPARRSELEQRQDTNEMTREAEIEEFEKRLRNAPDEVTAVTISQPVAVTIERFGDMDTITEVTRMKRRVNAINAAINSMAGAEGRKILILATERLGEIRGAERLFDAGAEELSSQDFRARTTRGTSMIDAIIDNANAAAVTIYPLYPAGRPVRLVSGGLEYLTVINETASLTRLARDTGGAEAMGTEYLQLMKRVEEDAGDYYSLAYRVESRRSDHERRLVVKTRDPKLIVRARRSYVEKSDQTRMHDRLMAALVRSTNDSMFSVEAQLGNTRSLKQRRLGRVPLQVRIPIGALTVVPENGTNVGVFSVFIVSGSGGEELSAMRRQIQRFEIPPHEMADAVSGHFTYNIDLVLNHSADRVAVGVLDELSKSYGVARVSVR